MSADAWIGIGAGVVAIFGAVIAWGKFMIRAPVEARNAALEAEKAQAQAARAEADGRSDRARERLADLDARFKALQHDMVNLRLGKTSVFTKHEIDTRLREAAEALGVIESSILVLGPPPNSSSFVFLSIMGPAATKLRLAKLKIDSGIVGRVFATGTLHNTGNAYRDPNFFPGIDKKGEHETQAMLTVPLKVHGKTVGVAQFLNKPGGFTEADEGRAVDLASLLAPRVATFIADAENFELLGLAGRTEEEQAAILFCDLTSFSNLLDQMNTPSAIDCINEYLEWQCGVAMSHGGTIDKYTGDGAMLRFVPGMSRDGDYTTQSVEAALEMREKFERLKEGWLSARLPVHGIYSRIGISCGTVHDAKIGHPQHQEITVIGETVNEAANLCETATRDRNVIVVSDHLAGRLDGAYSLRGADGYPERRGAQEVIGRTAGR
jgi:class 3 adenylate cyclase